MDWVYQLLLGLEIRHLIDNVIPHPIDFQRKDTDPTTGLTNQLFGTEQIFSKL